MGARPRRDPAGADRERAALAGRAPGRRPDADRPRRRRRGAAGRRRVRLLDRPAGRDRLHHDARLPPEHLPGRDRHPGPRAARRASRAAPTTSSTTCVEVAEEVRTIIASLGAERLERASSAARTCSSRTPTSTTPRPAKLDLSPLLTCPIRPRSRWTPATTSDQADKTDVLESSFDIREVLPQAAPRHPQRRAGPRRARRSATSTAPSAACSPTRSSAAARPRGPARRHGRARAARLDRPELSAPGSRRASRSTVAGTVQRLRGQGPLRRRARRPPARRSHVRRRART